MNYRGDQPVHKLAAEVCIGLAKNHAFVDGNKRVAFVALNMIIEENGYLFSISQDKAVELIEGIAKSLGEKGRLTPTEFEAIIAQHTRQMHAVTHFNFVGEDDKVSNEFTLHPPTNEFQWRVFGVGDAADLQLETRTFHRAMTGAIAYFFPGRARRSPVGFGD